MLYLCSTGPICPWGLFRAVPTGLLFNCLLVYLLPCLSYSAVICFTAHAFQRAVVPRSSCSNKFRFQIASVLHPFREHALAAGLFNQAQLFNPIGYGTFFRPFTRLLRLGGLLTTFHSLQYIACKSHDHRHRAAYMSSKPSPYSEMYVLYVTVTLLWPMSLDNIFTSTPL